jgi:basic membrane protein A
MDWTLKVANDFPNVYFGHCSGYKRAENMSTYFGKVYQARYLSGIAAGYRTKANKIGYVAAYPIPEVIRGINAFTLGVQSVNPDATVEVIWTSTWYDPAVEKQGAIELLNKGCDVIAQHQDTTAPQIAAQERGAFAVGYNVSTPNAAPKAYLTAPLFHWEVFYVDDVNHVIDGTWQSRAYWEGFSNGTVSLDDLTANNDPRAAGAVDKARDAIKAGTLEPFTGPLSDQSGAVKVPGGIKMTDDEIWNMGWFVKGVIGVIPN